MELLQSGFQYQSFNDIGELGSTDAALLRRAREATSQAYAPYSNFQVGAAIRLSNGETVTGSNQENASFPLGLCAERVALAATTSLYPGISIDTIAVSYNNRNGNSDRPVSPCGICRQVIAEYEDKFHRPIRLVLGGMNGVIFIVPAARLLLPLSFSSEDLK